MVGACGGVATPLHIGIVMLTHRVTVRTQELEQEQRGAGGASCYALGSRERAATWSCVGTAVVHLHAVGVVRASVCVGP